MDSSKNQYAINLLRKMLEIYSPSGMEHELAYFLKTELEKLNFNNVHIDEVGNVIAECGEGRPKIMFLGHIDTVEGYLPVKISENRIYGRGAVDAKSSMAAMLIASSKWIRNSGSASIMLCCLVEEEKGGRGIKNLLKKRLDADYAIFGEPCGVKRVTIGYKGHIGAVFSVKANPKHSSVVTEENAIESALTLLNNIKTEFSKHQSPKSYFDSLTSNIVKIEGGNSRNTTPESCTFYLDIRIPPRMNCDEVTAMLEKVTKEFNEKHNTKSSLHIEFKVEPVLIDKHSSIVRAITRAILTVAGRPVSYIKKTGTGDMNLFALKTSIPVATYGPGNPQLSHTFEECIDIDEYLTSIDIYYKIIDELSKIYIKQM